MRSPHARAHASARRPHPCPARRSPGRAAFTLIELLLSITILTILMLIVTNVISVVQRTWVQANSRVSQFREARGAFDTMVRNLGQATLNTYWQSVDPLGNATQTFQKVGGNSPTATLANAYVRQSELQFVSGPAPNILGPTGNFVDNPGHAVFFQAPLGVTKLATPTGAFANTENMVNLLCGRGYYVAWGDDEPFRPAFLSSVKTVRPRFRFRLMEYSPSAEMNQIYDSGLRPIVDPSTGTNFSKQWFQISLGNGSANITNAESPGSRAPLRPIADNVICLVISPQQDSRSTTGEIAPTYQYDSLLKNNPGTNALAFGPQGTQHLLPPLIYVTMIVVDSAGGERLAEDQSLRQSLSSVMQDKFLNAAGYHTPGSAYHRDISALEQYLVQSRLNYRVFSTTVIMKQARWSA